jgi:hypothetical protein
VHQLRVLRLPLAARLHFLWLVRASTFTGTGTYAPTTYNVVIH